MMKKSLKRGKKVKIGLVTIGQSPREDIVSDMQLMLGSNIAIEQSGALDGLTASEISQLRPSKAEFPLITRLNDGSSVVVGKKKIVPLLNQAITKLEQQGVELTGLLCTEEFNGLTASKPVALPNQIFWNMVSKFRIKGSLAILYPLKQQTKFMQEKWNSLGLKMQFIPFSPLGAESSFDNLITRLENRDIDIIYLDCFGYSAVVAWDIFYLTAKPVFLPRTMLAHYLKMFVINYHYCPTMD